MGRIVSTHRGSEAVYLIHGIVDPYGWNTQLKVRNGQERIVMSKALEIDSSRRSLLKYTAAGLLAGFGGRLLPHVSSAYAATGGRSQGVGRLLFPFRQHARRRRGHSCGGRRGYCGTSAGDAVSRGVPCDHGSGEAGTGVGLQAAFEAQDRAHRGVRRRFRGIAQLVGLCSPGR